MVDLLLDRGADAATPDSMGWTPLLSAAELWHVGIIRALLAHGCGDIDARTTREGRTALHLSCISGYHGGPARLLLEAGADWTILNNYKEGRTPLTLARSRGNRDRVAILEVRFLYLALSCAAEIRTCVGISSHLGQTNRPPSPPPPRQGPAPA
jgi:ankyrin repeat protein